MNWRHCPYIDELDFARSNCEHSEELQIYLGCLRLSVIFSTFNGAVLEVGREEMKAKKPWVF